MLQNYINHIALLLDASGSMSKLASTVVKVFDNEIKNLARRSQETNQETRVSVYTFSGKNQIECLVYDIDVMRMPSIAGYYSIKDMTALLDATMKAIHDLGQTPQLYGDHAFLIYALTDGMENDSFCKPDGLAKAIHSLPENWTLAVLVPDQRGVFEAKKAGFPADNIEVWDATSVKGLEAVGSRIRETSDHFFDFRSRGIRGTSSLFRPNISATPSQVKRALDVMNPMKYWIFRVPRTRDYEIRDFVEYVTGKSYVRGSTFYQLTERRKPHKVQDYKAIIIRDMTTGNCYTGDNARTLLGLPEVGEVKVKPGDFGNYDVFVQSTSVNRKLLAGTSVLVIK